MDMKMCGVLGILVLAAGVLIVSGCGQDGGSGDTGVKADTPDIPFIGKDLSNPGKDVPAGNHPPVLERIGDRVAAVGETLEIEATATDADGDELTYSVYGDIPPGAKFNKGTHVFTWVPLQADKVIYLTFTVSDGTDIDRETVEIKVVAEKMGHPPVFDEASDQKVESGKFFSMILTAQDPDGDELEFAFAGSGPAGGTIDGKTGLFQWTPPVEADGTVVPVTFVVSDGVFKDDMEVRFLVGDTAGGSPPVFDPVADQEAVVGKELSFSVKAVDPDGATVTLKVESGMPAGASFDAGPGTFRWTPGPADSGHVIDLGFSAWDGQYTAFLNVKVHVQASGQPPACSDDAFEPNNDAAGAKTLSPGSYDLSICDTATSPVDSDWFLVSLAAGQEIGVHMTFAHAQGDIDVSLAKAGPVNTVVAGSEGTSDEESFDYSPTAAGDFLLVVYGVANTKYSNPYHLDVSVSAVTQCSDDSLEPNDDTAAATKVVDLEKTFNGLKMCPGDDDFFAVTLSKDDTLLAAATPKSGSLGMQLLDPSGKVVDSAGPGSGPGTVAVEGTEAGVYHVRVHSDVEAEYTFEVLVEKAPAGCDAMSCPKEKVCDPSNGECVSDYCSGPAECPGGLPCLQTYCVYGCASHQDCRPDYLCKAFPDGDFCGQSGDVKSGGECYWFSQCADERVCLFEDMGGYCAVYGCASDWDCPLDAWCVQETYQGKTFNYCAADCEDEPCPGSSNFECLTGTTTDNLMLQLCLPNWIEV